MSRSISELLAAAFAGEPLTPAEHEQLALYDTKSAQFIDGLRQSLPQEERAYVETGQEIDDYLADVFNRLDALAPAPEVRDLVHELITLLRLAEDGRAEHKGRARGRTRRGKTGAQSTAAKKRNKAAVLLNEIDAVKARRSPAHSDAAAARIYLDDTEHDWHAWTEAKRNRSIANLERRISRARAKKKDATLA